jgi:two-component system, cell cycle sensor histidine kinase and response regulator CckA
MAQEKDSEGKFSGLRTRAEETLSREPSDMEDISALSPADIQRLVHELRVHQIELEMQNEDLRQAQVKLEELKDRYLDLYDFAPVGYVTLNDKGLILEANLTAVRLLGIERQRLTKMFFSRFVSQQFGDAYYLYLQQVFETQSKQTCEIELARKDGTRFYAQLESVAVQDETGQFKQCRTMVSDITERKHVEEELERLNAGLEEQIEIRTHALRESEERFRNVFEQGPLGIAIVGLDYRWIAVNATLCEMVGYTEDELAKLTFVDITHPEDIEADVGYAEKLSRGEIPSYKMEKRYIRKNGTVIWINLTGSIVSDDRGKALYFLAMIEDITERKQAEASAREHEVRYRVLVENLSEGVFVVRDGALQLVNSRVVEIAGYSADELTFGPFLKFVHPDDREMAMQQHMNRMAGDDTPHQFPMRIVARDGSVKWLFVASRMILWHGERASLISATDITSHKEADEALRESEGLLTAVLDALPDVVGVQLPDHTITRYNRAGYELLGLAPEEAHGRKCYELIGRPEQCQPCATARALKSKRPESLERYFPELGRYLWCTSTPLLDPSGEVRLVIERLLDLTERKKAEVALAESEQRFRAVFNNNHAVMLLIDPETGAIEDCSPGACSFYGYNKEDLTTKKLTEINTLPPEQLFENIQAAKTEQQYFGDFRHRLASGEIRDVEVCSGPITAGGRTFLFSVINDVTERKKAEEARLRSERKYRTLFDESRDGVFAVLREGEITDANPSFLEIFGYTREEMIGMDIRDLYINPADYAKFQNEIDKEGFVKDYEAEFRKRDGTQVGCALTSSVKFSDDGRLVGYRGIVRDVTARRALQRQLQHAQKMEAVGTLAGGVAHDFNNLLQVVLGYSDLILTDEDLPDRLKDDLEKVLLAGRNGADLVQRLLTFSRKAEVKPLELDLNQRVRQTHKFLQRTIPKMIDIELILAEDLARIHADPTQLDQILMNLSINARDAMPEGGKLVIETANVVIDEDYARSRLEGKPGRYVLLRVSDTGNGMNKETLDHIFEPFFTTKEAGKGTGLGLAMVYGIVTQHGGQILCYSEPGHGTTFKIYLPALAAERKQSEPATREAMPRGGAETILLVDDEELVRDLGKRILELSGYTVLTAANGKEALDLYRREREKISLVILDLMMPKMGGKECFDKILRLDPRAKVLIASGYSSGGTTRETLEGVSKGFIRKPYDLNKLLKTVRDALNEK